jgi:hypothetical protein
MLKITVNNIQLSLPDSFSVRIKRRSPLFVRDSLGKEFTYPVMIPFDGRNQEAMKYLNRQDLAKGENIFTCQLTIGTETADAILTVYEVTDEGYDAHMKFNQGALDDLLKDVTLSSALSGQVINMGDNAQAVRNFATQTVLNPANENGPVIFFPIRNERFYENHPYHGQQFGSRVLMMWREMPEDFENNNGLGFYIGTFNKCTGEVKRYTFTYRTAGLVTNDNEFIPNNQILEARSLFWGLIDLQPEEIEYPNIIPKYIKLVRESLQNKSYLRDWNIVYTTDSGLPIDKYEPTKQEYNGLIITSTDEDIVFFNAAPIPFGNFPELNFFNQKSPNENLNHWGYLGEQQFTIDEYRQSSCLLRIQNAPDGWPFYHVGFNLVPQLRVPYVLKQIFKQVKAGLSGIFQTDAEMQQLILYCNYAIDKVEDIEFMETLHPELTISRPDEDPVTPGTQVNQLYRVNTLQKWLDLGEIPPNLSAAQFIISLLNHFGLALLYDNTRNAYSIKWLKDFLVPRKVIDWSKRPGIQFGKEYNDTLRFKAFKFNPEKELQCIYQKDLPANSLKGTVENRKDLEAIPIDLLSDGDIYYVNQENAYYIYEVNKVLFNANNFAFYANKQGDISINPDGIEIDSGVTEPYDHRGDTATNPAFTYYKVMKYRLPGDANTDESWAFNWAQEGEVLKNEWKVPHIPESGKTPEWRQKSTDPALRFLFYRGLKLDANGNRYPLATADVTDYYHSKVGERSVSINGPYGTYNKGWKEWIQMLNNSELHYFDKQLRSWELLNPNWEDHIKIENQHYLIYEIEAVIDLYEIKQCRETLVRL